MHNEEVHIYWTEDYIEIKYILLNMKPLSGSVVSERNEQETCVRKSISFKSKMHDI